MFFFLAFSLQLVLLVPTQTDAERWITVAALPITLSILVLGYFAVKREHKGLFYAFLSGCAIGCAYFIYKVRLTSLLFFFPLSETDEQSFASQLFIIYRDRETDYRLVFKSLTVFAALCLAALIWTTTTAIVCFRNFGRGLKYQSASTLFHFLPLLPLLT
jgi:hypothetical protein